MRDDPGPEVTVTATDQSLLVGEVVSSMTRRCPSRSLRDRGPRRVGDSAAAGACDAGLVSNRVAHHRHGRPTPVAPVVVDERDAFDEVELLCLLVNYHRSPLGAWTATVAPDELEPVTLQATSAHDAFHKAMELTEALSAHADVAISTMHTLDGDPIAWVALVAREGFVDCAMTDHTTAALIAHD